MATCAVSGTLKDISETAISGAVIRAHLVTPQFSGTTQLMPTEVTTTSAADGTWSLSLSQGQNLLVYIEFPPNSSTSRQVYTYSVLVPATTTANFSAIATEL